MATVAKVGRGSLLKMGGTIIAETTAVEHSLPLGNAQVTPLGTGGAEEYLSTNRSLILSVSGHWLSDFYGHGGSGSVVNIINQWATLASPTWRVVQPNLDAYDIVGFIRQLSINVQQNQPVTFDLDIRAQMSSGNLIARTTDTTSAQTSSAVIGMGLHARVSDTTSDTPVRINEVTGIRAVFTTGEAEATSVESDFIEEWLPTTRGMTLEFDVNVSWAAVASRASVLAATGSTTQPSLYELYEAHRRTKWQVAWKNEPGVGGGTPYQVWTVFGTLEEIRWRLATSEVAVATIPIRVDGDITISAEA